MSDRLRKAGLVKVKPVEAQKPPEAAVAPLARVTPAPPEPIAKPATKTIDLESYQLKVTPETDRFKVEICSKSGSTPVVVTPDAREIVNATIELPKNSNARVYVSKAGSLDILELNVAEDVSGKINAVESLKAGKTREHAFSESDITGKAILLESGERIVYVKEHDALHIFNREGRVESLTADKTNDWVREVGAYKVWYDPRDPEYLITVGHTEELAKVREVEAREIKFSDTERTFGATKGMMRFKVADEEIQVNIEVDAEGKLTSASKTNSKGRGIELEENDGTIRVTNIFGRQPTATTKVNEVWNTQSGTHVEILGSRLTDLKIVWNKIKGIARVTTYAPALDNLAEIVDGITGLEVSNRSGRITFNYKGKNYELNLSRDQIMLTQVQAPQPAPRSVAPEPKIFVDDGKKATTPPQKGAERAEPRARTQVMKAENPEKAIEADDEPEPGEESNKGNRVAAFLGGIVLAFGLAFFGVKSYLTKPEEPVQQTTQDSTVVIAPPPAPTILAPPPVIAPPPVTAQTPVPDTSTGTTASRDAGADATPVRRRRSSTSSGGFGNFEGM
jgi:hypothetical protein